VPAADKLPALFILKRHFVIKNDQRINNLPKFVRFCPY
jgi:hypothetical protein